MRAIRLLINMRMLTLVRGLAHFSTTAASCDQVVINTLSLSHPSSSNGSVVAGATSAVAPDILGRFPLRKRSRTGRVLAELTLLLLVPTASASSSNFSLLFFMNAIAFTVNKGIDRNFARERRSHRCVRTHPTQRRAARPSKKGHRLASALFVSRLHWRAWSGSHTRKVI